MRIVHFQLLEDLRRIPLYSEGKSILVSEAEDDCKIVFISHRWHKTKRGESESVNSDGHGRNLWDETSRFDHGVGAKYKAICSGVKKLAHVKGWNTRKVYLWIDCSCVRLSDSESVKASLASFRGYISVCDAVMIPKLHEACLLQHTSIDMLEADCFQRSWMRLECMWFYAVGVFDLCMYVCMHSLCVRMYPCIFVDAA
jgi:hypothetical protein